MRTPSLFFSSCEGLWVIGQMFMIAGAPGLNFYREFSFFFKFGLNFIGFEGFFSVWGGIIYRNGSYFLT